MSRRLQRENVAAVTAAVGAAKTGAVQHRCRFLEYIPQGIITVAMHPSGEFAAVARENGDVEIWRSDSMSEPWVCLLTLAGAARLAIQAMVWVAADSQLHKGRAFSGARLFVASLSGTLYEASWHGAGLVKVLDSNGGSIWSMATFTVTGLNTGNNTGALPRGLAASALHTDPGAAKPRTPGGTLLALGCEDGSVRVYGVPFSADTAGLALASASGSGSGAGAFAAAVAEDAFLAPPLLCICPGTDGRVLSLAWHPSLPILYGGTGTGFIRGWDMTRQCTALAPRHTTAEGASGASAAGGRKRSASAGPAAGGSAAGAAAGSVGDAEAEAARLWGELALKDDAPAPGRSGSRRKARAGSEDSEGSSDEEESEEDEGGSGAAGDSLADRASARGGAGGGAGAAPRPVIRMQLESLSKHDTCVWCLAVLTDLTVVAGDSRGNVTVWDGRTGTLACAQPVARHEGDVLSLSVHESVFSKPAGLASTAAASLRSSAAQTGSGSHVVVVSAGVDGKVSAVKRMVSKKGSSARWLALGGHRGHGSDVRSVCLLPVPISSLSLAGTLIGGEGAQGDGKAAARAAAAAAGVTSGVVAGAGAGAGKGSAAQGAQGSQGAQAPVFALTAVSGGADAFLCAMPVCLFGSSVAQPKRMHEVGSGRNRDRLAIAGGAASVHTSTGPVSTLAPPPASAAAAAGGAGPELPPLLLAFAQGPTGVEVWEMSRAAGQELGRGVAAAVGASDAAAAAAAAAAGRPSSKRPRTEEAPAAAAAAELAAAGGGKSTLRLMRGETAVRGKVATSIGEHTHWLTVTPPGTVVKGTPGPGGVVTSGSGASSVSVDPAGGKGPTFLVPAANPSAVALSQDGQWLAYATAAAVPGAPLPGQGGNAAASPASPLQIVRLRHEYEADDASDSEDDSDSDGDSGSEDEGGGRPRAGAASAATPLPRSRPLASLTPVRPDLPAGAPLLQPGSGPTVLKLLFAPLPAAAPATTAAPAAIGGGRFGKAAPASAAAAKAAPPTQQQLLIAVTPGQLTVFLCSDRPAAAGFGAASAAAAASPLVSYLYSLPIPAGAADGDALAAAVAAAASTSIGLGGARTAGGISRPGGGPLGHKFSAAAESDGSDGEEEGEGDADTLSAPRSASLRAGSLSDDGSTGSASVLSTAAAGAAGGALGVRHAMGRKARQLAQRMGGAGEAGGMGATRRTRRADPHAVIATALAASPLLLQAPAAAAAKGAAAAAAVSGGLGAVLLTVATHTGAVHTYLLARSLGALLSSSAEVAAAGRGGARSAQGQQRAPPGATVTSLVHAPFPMPAGEASADSVSVSSAAVAALLPLLAAAAGSGLGAGSASHAVAAAAAAALSAVHSAAPGPLAAAAAPLMTLAACSSGRFLALHPLSSSPAAHPAALAFARAATVAWTTACRYHSTGATVTSHRKGSSITALSGAAGGMDALLSSLEQQVTAPAAASAAAGSSAGAAAKAGAGSAGSAAAAAPPAAATMKADPRIAAVPAPLSAYSHRDREMAASGFSWVDIVQHIVPMQLAAAPHTYAVGGAAAAGPHRGAAAGTAAQPPLYKYLLYGVNHALTLTFSATAAPAAAGAAAGAGAGEGAAASPEARFASQLSGLAGALLRRSGAEAGSSAATGVKRKRSDAAAGASAGVASSASGIAGGVVGVPGVPSLALSVAQHPHKYMNCQAAALVGQAPPLLPLGAAAGHGHAAASQTASPTLELAVVELPWRGFARYMAAALERRRYGR